MIRHPCPGQSGAGIEIVDGKRKEARFGGVAGGMRSGGVAWECAKIETIAQAADHSALASRTPSPGCRIQSRADKRATSGSHDDQVT